MRGRRAYQRRPAGRAARRERRLVQVLKGQIITCVVIVAAVILLKTMSGAFAEESIATFQSAMEKDYKVADIVDSAAEAVGQAGNLPSRILTAIREGEKRMAFSAPADGDAAVAVFGQEGKSLRFYYDSGEALQVYAAAGGTVAKADSQGGYVIVNHGNDIQTVYGGLAVIYVEELARVKKGELLGSCASGEEEGLTFELWVDGALADPAEYLEF
ncbi:MAG: M23 family metallopeptidase [Bacillota bacterium]|nr:M23 family metallopeptidase [Bacillota bacterium]